MRTAAINLRAFPAQRDLIDYAASLLGKSRSDFMLDITYQAAQDVILDRTIFPLDAQAFQRFTAILEQPAEENEGLKRLMSVKPVWEKE